jgi:hypothetical protein
MTPEPLPSERPSKIGSMMRTIARLLSGYRFIGRSAGILDGIDGRISPVVRLRLNDRHEKPKHACIRH